MNRKLTKRKEKIKVFKHNINSLICVELYYYFLISAILMLFSILSKFQNNLLINSFITISVILFILISSLEFLTLSVIYHFSNYNKKISAIDSVQLVLVKIQNFSKKNNILAIPNLIIISIFMKIPIMIMFIYFLSYSNMLSLSIQKDIIYLFLLFYIIISYFVSKLRYVPYYMIFENYNIKKSIKNSKIVSGKGSLLDKFRINLIQLFSTLLYIAIVLSLSFIIKNYYNYSQVANTQIEFIINSFNLIILIILAITMTLIGLFFEIKSFYSNKKTINENSKILAYPKKRNKLYKLIKISFYSFILLTIILNNILNSYKFNFYKIKNNFQKIEVIGHRGASSIYPENTMAAIYGAVELDSDWVEIDVHQTRDKHIVLSHDDNLLRVANVDRRIADMTYEQLKNIDVGSFFDARYSTEKIPLLEDVIKFAKKNGVKLNIEMKPIGNESSFETEVVKLVQEYDYQESCMISSFSYSELETIKKLDNKITTAFLMFPVIGDVSNLEYADILSIEFSNITNKVVYDIHKQGKEVNVWVANDEESIRKLIEMDVDKITTDNVGLAKEIIDRVNESKTLQ